MTPCLKLCANQMKSFYILSFALFYSAYILFICFHLLFLKGSGREAADYNKKKKSRLTTTRGQQRHQKSLATIKKATRIKLATKTTIDSDRLDWDLNSHRLPTILNRYTLYDYLNHYTTSCSTCTIPRSVDYHVATTSPEKNKVVKSTYHASPSLAPSSLTLSHINQTTDMQGWLPQSTASKVVVTRNGSTCAAYWCCPTLD
jgi:hypothetical protein